MKTINGALLVFSIILFFCCNKESDKDNDSSDKNPEAIELRDNFSETEFKNALIGEWGSVFENTEYENVIYLKFNIQGKSSIKIKKDNVVNEYSGDYSVSFIREPAEGYITLAKISISCSNKEIVLSRVYFGLHNALPVDSGLFLRIEGPPYGVLDRIE